MEQAVTKRLSTREHVLVIEDEELTLSAMTFILTRSGYGVTSRRDGSTVCETIEACQKKSSPIDIIITDLIMPVVSGDEIVLEVRRRYPLIPIVVITGFIQKELRAKLEQMGVSQFIPKPFSRQELISSIEDALKKRSREV